MLDFVGLSGRGKDKIGGFSHGMKQRLGIAQTLLHQPDLIILDEPTTGLHFDDIRKLVELLQDLVDQGNTVLVIEHNLEVIKCADHVIDLGYGGKNGGQIVATGTPEQVSKNKRSETGKFLQKIL